MKTLKKEFTFNYLGQQIQVKLIGEVYCSIFGKIAKPLVIEKEIIYLKEGKLKLAELPKTAYQVDPIEILKQIKALLNSVEL
jgi:hypothetical protein